MLAGLGDRRPRAVGGNHGGGGAVAEQRRGDDVALRGVGRAEGQRAQLDRREQHRPIRHLARQAARARQAEHAADAAEAEDRQPGHVARQREALDQERIQARCRHAGGRDHHHRPDIGRSAAGALEGGRAGRLDQVEGVAHVASVTGLPALRLEIALERQTGVAGRDTGVVEYRQQPLELAAPGEDAARRGLGLFLAQHVRRHGGGQRQEMRPASSFPQARRLHLVHPSTAAPVTT